MRKYASHIKKNTFFIARRIAAGKTEDGGPTIPYHPPPHFKPSSSFMR